MFSINLLLDEASLVYIATSGICSNPGKVVDSNGRSLLHIAASVGKRFGVTIFKPLKFGFAQILDIASPT